MSAKRRRRYDNEQQVDSLTRFLTMDSGAFAGEMLVPYLTILERTRLQCISRRLSDYPFVSRRLALRLAMIYSPCNNPLSTTCWKHDDRVTMVFRARFERLCSILCPLLPSELVSAYPNFSPLVHAYVPLVVANSEYYETIVRQELYDLLRDVSKSLNEHVVVLTPGKENNNVGFVIYLNRPRCLLPGFDYHLVLNDQDDDPDYRKTHNHLLIGEVGPTGHYGRHMDIQSKDLAINIRSVVIAHSGLLVESHEQDLRHLFSLHKTTKKYQQVEKLYHSFVHDTISLALKSTLPEPFTWLDHYSIARASL